MKIDELINKKMPKNNIEKLQLPEGSKDNKVLMHSCCAPCAGDLMLRMKESGIDVTIFFYNPNIHPKKEYEIRKQIKETKRIRKET